MKLTTDEATAADTAVAWNRELVQSRRGFIK